ncbi:MAG: hypothetical protein R2778_01710 [Saprospiraceae bacterium]
MDNQQLVTRLKKQDRTAVGELYDAYAPALFGVVIRIVQSREISEQVIQDTFLKAGGTAMAMTQTKGGCLPGSSTLPETRLLTPPGQHIFNRQKNRIERWSRIYARRRINQS